MHKSILENLSTEDQRLLKSEEKYNIFKNFCAQFYNKIYKENH